MRWTVPVALVGVLVLGGCAGERTTAGATASAPAGASPSATPATATPTASAAPTGSPAPATATAPATAPPTATVPTGSPVVPAVSPITSITEACATWQTSLGQDAQTFPATQGDAAGRAASAAAGDAQWQPLATDMATLVSIGSDSSASAVAQGQQLFTDLSTRCGAIGVTVSAG